MYKSQEQSDKVGKVGFDSQLGGTLISQGHLSIHYYLIKKDPIVFLAIFVGVSCLTKTAKNSPTNLKSGNRPQFHQISHVKMK